MYASILGQYVWLKARASSHQKGLKMSRKKIETSDPNFSIDVYDRKFVINSYDDRLTLIALGEVLAHFDVEIKEVEDE